MRRVLLECAVLVVAFAVTVPTAARAGEMLSGVRWVYRAEVHDLTRDVPSTTEVEVLSFVGADGLQGWVVTTMTEWATTLAVLPRDPEDEGNPDVTGPPHALSDGPPPSTRSSQSCGGEAPPRCTSTPAPLSASASSRWRSRPRRCCPMGRRSRVLLVWLLVCGAQRRLLVVRSMTYTRQRTLPLGGGPPTMEKPGGLRRTERPVRQISP